MMDKIADQVGYLVLTEDGAVLESGGELENNEHVAAIVTDLIALSNKVDPVAFSTNEQFKKITITFEDHWFTICVSNKKIYIVKRLISRVDAEGNTINV